MSHASLVSTGYSRTPLVKKLGLKEGQVVAVLDAPALLSTGLVDNKVAALDPDWSGLRFVWRKGLRDAVARSAPNT